MPVNMEADLTALSHAPFQSNVEVKQAKPRSGSDIKTCAPIEWKEKKRLLSTKLSLI